MSKSTSWTRRHEWRGVEVEYDCEVEYSVSGRDRPARFSKSFGNWLPGEDAEIEVESVVVEATGEEILDELSTAEQERLEDYIRDHCADTERDAAEAAAEDEADRRADR